MMITGAFKTEKVHVIMNTPKEKGDKKKKNSKAEKRATTLYTAHQKGAKSRLHDKI